MNSTPPKWLDPPLLVALAASYIAGAVIAFYLTATLLAPYLGDLHLPRLPFPGGGSSQGGDPPPAVTIAAPTFTFTSTLRPSTATPEDTSTPEPSTTATLVGVVTETPSVPPVPSMTRTEPALTATPEIAATVTPTKPRPTATATKKPKPKPTATKTREPLPESAQVQGVVGHPMISSLDCEARAAVDWAGFFGKSIDEKEFLDKMPYSDNPEKGFVGHWYDIAGGIPPNPYGIHAKPVAEELRDEFGVKAVGRKGLKIEDVLYEVAHGRPVIVWVVGPVQPAKIGVEYTAPDGQKMLVAAYEHTVMLTGYDQDNVTILDGSWGYTRSKADFLVSWAQLGNMAIIRGE